MLSKDALKEKYKALSPLLDERSLRLAIAADAKAMGYGGISQVARASGFSRTTIHAGIKELESQEIEAPALSASSPRIRRPGGGRKPLKEKDETIITALEQLLDPVTRGDPMSPLRWTCKSTSELAKELKRMGYQVSQRTVWRLLDEMGYSMQSNRKTLEGSTHPDRNAQFEFINQTVQDFLARGLPVISVDAKKKELIGPFKNEGKQWLKKGEPVKVRVYDFLDHELGKAIPYGVYDIGRNEGWVSVGIDHDTAEFAAETIYRWWEEMGRHAYPDAKELLITADGGGSNGSRVRLWKVCLQILAEKLDLTIHVRHFPPGTSKWNKIEHRMFCHITRNWRGRPLESRMIVVNLISNTTTNAGLIIQADLDEHIYQTGLNISDKVMAALMITKCEFHGEWNYKFGPFPGHQMSSLI
jgi:transposase